MRRVSVLVIGAVGLAPCAALGQAVLDHDSKTAYGSVVYGNIGDDRFTEVQSDGSGGSGVVNGDILFDLDGYSSSSGATWSHAYDTGNPGPGGQFDKVFLDGHAYVSAANTNEGITRTSDGFGTSYIRFTLDEETPWTWTADILGTSSDRGNTMYNFRIWETHRSFDPLVSDQRYGDFNESISLDGVLAPGSYTVAIDICADAQFQTSWATDSGFGFVMIPSTGTGTAEAFLNNGVFSLLGPVPAPGAGATMVLAAGLTAVRRRR